MIQGSLRRDARRIAAVIAGAAVAATTVGLAAPAHAAESAVGGVVVDTAGNPVSGILYAYEQGEDANEYYDDWLFINNGVVSGTLEDGSYKFEVNVGGGDAYSEFYLDKPDLASADAVIVGGGAVSLSTWVVDQPYVIATVTDPSGRPLADVDVSAYDATTEDYVANDQSDRDGTVVLPVGAGPVKLRAGGTSDLGSEWYNDKPDFASADPVTGTVGGTPVAIALNPAGAITGQILSDAGAPLEHVRVGAKSEGTTGSYWRYDYTDKNGVFVLESVPSGSYWIEISDNEIGEYATEYYNNVPDEDLATPVRVTSGAVTANINANLTPLPAKTAGSLELSGVVTDDAGAPVVGAPIAVWNTPAAPFKKDASYVYSNRAGVYAFDSLEALSGKSVKVQALAPEAGDEEAYGLFGQWFGQRTSYDRAAPIAIAAGGAARADVVLPRSGGISGSVLGAPGVGLDGSVSLLSVDGDFEGGASTKADNTFETRYLYPGTYKVMFSDNEGNHVPEWWKNSSFEDAKTITVKSGETVTGLDAVLDAALSATERPSIDGYPWVGKSIKVDRGEWNFENGTQFSYEWMIGNDVVGTGESFKPSKKQIGDKLTVRVLAENGELAGTVSTAKSAKIGYKSKIKAKVRGERASIKIKAQKIKGKKVKGKLVVKEIVRVKNDGTIKYKTIGKTKIKKGKGNVSLKKLKKGKHKLVFFFKGKGKVGSSELTKKVKVKR